VLPQLLALFSLPIPDEDFKRLFPTGAKRQISIASPETFDAFRGAMEEEKKGSCPSSPRTSLCLCAEWVGELPQVQLGLCQRFEVVEEVV
jgi:hypothetical protein